MNSTNSFLLTTAHLWYRLQAVIWSPVEGAAVCAVCPAAKAASPLPLAYHFQNTSVHKI